jgi:hypothetical protein
MVELDTKRSSSEQKPTLDTTINLGDMLLEEYKQANTMALVTLNDRTQLFNNYLFLAGGFAAAAFGAISQLSRDGAGERFMPLVILTLLIIGLLGVVFFMQVLRLRLAFRQSLVAMDRIREYYIRQFRREVPDIDRAFLWDLDQAPSSERLRSNSFLIAYVIAFMDSLFLAGAVFLSYQAYFSSNEANISGPMAFLLAGTVFVILALLHSLYYRRVLSRHSGARAIDRLLRNNYLDAHLMRQ